MDSIQKRLKEVRELRRQMMENPMDMPTGSLYIMGTPNTPDTTPDIDRRAPPKL
jgi:hypothetical protein